MAAGESEHTVLHNNNNKLKCESIFFANVIEFVSVCVFDCDFIFCCV